MDTVTICVNEVLKTGFFPKVSNVQMLDQYTKEWTLLIKQNYRLVGTLLILLIYDIRVIYEQPMTFCVKILCVHSTQHALPELLTSW